MNIAKELRALGLEVKKVKGWQERGRDYPWNPDGILNHHTASNKKSGNIPSLGICVHGRAGIPGPLCHYLVGRDGLIVIIADDRANHAGYGGPWRWIPRDSGNTFAIGIEIENDGIGERYKPKQLKAVAMLNAVILRHLGRGTRRVGSHKEYAPNRKIDPSFNMKEFRKMVKEAQGQLEPKPKPKPKKSTKGRWPTIKQGDKGKWVRKAQRKLKRRGFPSGPVDGLFGKRTRRAVKLFQKQESLQADGVVGRKTWKRLRGKG